MNALIWTLFVQTGNIETYLLLKHIEEDVEFTTKYKDDREKEIASLHTKL